MPRVRTVAPFLDKSANRVRAIGHTFDCDEARAAHLAGLGLVEAADGSQEWPPPRRQAQGAPAEPPAEPRPAEIGGDPSAMTRAELVAYAESIGVSVPAQANKAKVISLIAAAEGR